jgi:hypothetical protein
MPSAFRRPHIISASASLGAIATETSILRIVVSEQEVRMPRRQNQIETLEARVAELSERVLLIEAEVRGTEAAESAAPARSLRRATARRASKRRALARTLKLDTKELVLEYLGKHPGSTAGDVAKGLDLNRSTVSSSLAALLKVRRVRKADHGYEPE